MVSMLMTTSMPKMMGRKNRSLTTARPLNFRLARSAMNKLNTTIRGRLMSMVVFSSVKSLIIVVLEVVTSVRNRSR